METTCSTHLNKEEGNSVGPQRAAQLNVAEFCVQLAHVVQFAVFPVDEFLDALDLDVLPRQELCQVQETLLVFGLAVVAIGNLTLEGGKLESFFSGAGMSSLHNGIAGLEGEGESFSNSGDLGNRQKRNTQKPSAVTLTAHTCCQRFNLSVKTRLQTLPYLDVEKVQLDWIVSIDILVGEEELLPQSEDGSLRDALLSQTLVRIQPVHWGRRERRGRRGGFEDRKRWPVPELCKCDITTANNKMYTLSEPLPCKKLPTKNQTHNLISY